MRVFGNNYIIYYMKKQLLGLLTILTVFVACQKNEVASLSEDVTIHATIEDKDATKTIMDENNNILWSENDQIIAFMKSSYGHKYQVKPSFVGKSYAEFLMVSSGSSNDLFAGNEWDHNVVYYPFSENIECLKSGSNYALEVNLPTEQVYVPNSFANGSMAMVAVSENNNITFKNVLGGIKLQLKGTQTVKSIKIEGNNNEKLSGAATVTAYTDDSKPTIEMSQSASTSVTLNCGHNGVQLNERYATEFIISMPPVVFSNGFSVTVTGTHGNTKKISTDKNNTVYRSSLLVMPEVDVNDVVQFIGESAQKAEMVGATLEKIIEGPLWEQYNMDSAPIYHLTYRKKGMPMKISIPSSAVSHSSNPYSKSHIFKVNNIDFAETGGGFSLIDGGVDIYMTPDESSTYERGNFCFYNSNMNVVLVLICTLDLTSSSDLDYIDEYGVNHGNGMNIDGTTWAPVNCGYHSTDFKYGKLYQWGRKYGQGYCGKLYDKDENHIGEYSDAIIPELVAGPIDIINGQSESNKNKFYYRSDYPRDWLDIADDKLWNAGTEENPVQTQHDPCPTGWRIPTNNELKSLTKNHSTWTTNELGEAGYWLSGSVEYSKDVPSVFFSAAGFIYDFNGHASSRGYLSYYWSSASYNNNAKYLFLLKDDEIGMNDDYRLFGYSVRCVQE